MLQPDKEILANCYREFLEKAWNTDDEAMIQFTENELTDFIRQYVQTGFTTVYDHVDRSFYDQIRSAIPVNAQMRQANQQSGEMISRALKFYSEFLQSKYFPRPKAKKQQKPSEHTKPEPTVGKKPVIVEREETEGERKHVEFERAHRNPALRQRCIELWGYQCQCCGIDMEKIYGELGKNFIEVHHLKPISTYDESRPDDYVNNLVPLCPNCHAMIHHGADGTMSLHDLRNAYQGPKYELANWKED